MFCSFISVWNRGSVRALTTLYLLKHLNKKIIICKWLNTSTVRTFNSCYCVSVFSVCLVTFENSSRGGRGWMIVCCMDWWISYSLFTCYTFHQSNNFKAYCNSLFLRISFKLSIDFDHVETIYTQRKKLSTPWYIKT